MAVIAWTCSWLPNMLANSEQPQQPDGGPNKKSEQLKEAEDEAEAGSDAPRSKQSAAESDSATLAASSEKEEEVQSGEEDSDLSQGSVQLKVDSDQCNATDEQSDLNADVREDADSTDRKGAFSSWAALPGVQRVRCFESKCTEPRLSQVCCCGPSFPLESQVFLRRVNSSPPS